MYAHAMSQAQIHGLDRRLPRYTSYPTAAQFGKHVDAATYVGWLKALPAEEVLSLYLHVPFCAQLCLYCGCHTTVARRYHPVAAYVDLLEREIALVGALLGMQRRAVHVHWGGGTPTMLSAADFQRIMLALRQVAVIGGDSEVAIEVDPRTLRRELVPALADAGVTRASLGVQDFDARVQRAVGRVQSYVQTAEAVERLRDAGVAGINLDLMYGLPFQTPESVAVTVRQALTLDPDRIALFGYAHVPWMKRHQRLLPEAELPRASERLMQAQVAADALVDAGYVRIGLDHFAKPGDALAVRQKEKRLHRNFQGYPTDQAGTLIGFGTSAIGMLPQGYVQNAARTLAYREAILAGRPATARGLRLTAEDRLRREIIERLMCDLEVDLGVVARKHGRSLKHLAGAIARLGPLVEDGFVTLSGGVLSVAGHARPYLRHVCAAFDSYLTADETRFSRAF